ncbi:MAG: cytochrome c [Nannocystaceae bacterium]|nr:cytochrome c [Nannocystaceae bacterium]
MMRCATLFLLSVVGAGCEGDPPKFSAPMVLGGQEVSAEVLNAGHRSFEMRCASCHGHDGSGQGPASTGLAQPPRDFRQADFKYKSAAETALPTDGDLDLTIRNGRLANGMPAFSGLTDDDRHAIIQYLKTFSPRWAEARPEAS